MYITIYLTRCHNSFFCLRTPKFRVSEVPLFLVMSYLIPSGNGMHFPPFKHGFGAQDWIWNCGILSGLLPKHLLSGMSLGVTNDVRFPSTTWKEKKFSVEKYFLELQMT